MSVRERERSPLVRRHVEGSVRQRAASERPGINVRQPRRLARSWRAEGARQEERTLSKALTSSAGGTKYCVGTDGAGMVLRDVKVTPRHFIDGGMSVKDRPLPVTAYGQYAAPDPAEDEKTFDVRLGAVIAARTAARQPARTLTVERRQSSWRAKARHPRPAVLAAAKAWVLGLRPA